MSELLKSIISGNELEPGVSFIDADTIVKDGQKYRLQGFDAPEIAKWGEDGEQYANATAGGFAANQRIQQLAKEQGFTNIVETDQTDPNGRPIIELHNGKGENFTTKLLQSGALRTNKYTTESDVDAVRVADLFRNQANEGEQQWAESGQEIANLISKEYGDDLAFKKSAIHELQYSAAPWRYSSNVQFRHGDRDINNHANSPFSEAWDSGMMGVTEAAWGVLDMLGESTDWEWAKDVGEAGITRARSRMADQAQVLTDYKDVKGFGDAMEFLSANLAMSLPYMAVTMAASAAAPFTGGLSLTAPAAIYSGQTWNEQDGDNKDAGVAIASGVAQAALDRLGLSFLISKGKLPTEMFKDGVEELVRRGMGRTAAEQTMAGATRKVAAGLVGDVGAVAKDQLKKKKVVMDLLKGGGIAAAGEGGTEALQETLAYLGANKDQWMGDKAFDWGELQERAIGAAVAGSSLGGGFGVAGTTIDKGAWADLAWRQAPADARNLSQAGRYAEQEMADRGYVPTIQELVAETNAAPDALLDFDSRVEADKQRKGERDLKDTILEVGASVPALWRGATRWIFKPEIQQQSRSARILADMFGGNLQRTFSGSTFENWKHHKVSKYRNMVEMPKKFWQVMNDGKKVNHKRRSEISSQVYNTLQAATDADGNFNPDLIPDGPKKQYLIQFQQQLQALSDQMWRDQAALNPELGYIKNYLTRYKAFDKQAIADNRIDFINALTNKFGMTEAEASSIADNIINDPNVNDIEEAFSITNGTPRPGSHKKRSLDLAEQPEFQRFMQQDIFANISNAAKAATRWQAHEQFVGKGGKNIAKLLDQMQAEGVPAETVNKIAAQLKNYLDAESGNYKRPSSEFGKSMEKLQKNFMLLTTFAGLGLSAVSSMVELGLTMRGLTSDQVFGKGGLKSIGTELADTLWQGMKEVGGAATGREATHNRTAAKDNLQNLGFYDWEVGAATTTGVTETNALKQKWIEAFFKWNGLQGWTQYTRAVRASMAGDFIFNHLDTIANATEVTNEVQEAREALRTIGIDPYRLEEALQQNNEAYIEEAMREGTFNFINEAVALPQAANRPLIFQDPRFALFTQFQGFIATFTANHIPKMWGEYVKRGSPAMKYNAFATMMTMIALGFASQHLKDLLKYGGKTPYLNEAEHLRRGLFSSGLLGTGERVVDTLFPLYDSSSDGVGEWVWNETTGQSPALSNLSSVGEGIGDIATGDVSGGVKGLLRSTPIVAPLSNVRNMIADATSGWNFKGE